MSDFAQHTYDVRLEWGMAAVEHLAQDVDCIVVIDVISFATCVSIAVDRGAMLLPYPWKDHSAKEYAQQKGATVAHAERRVDDAEFSLSPQSLLTLPADYRLVLPSPNGSAITFKAKETAATIFCASLRNLQATAAVCQKFSRILLVPCGERWPDGSLRPALEDLTAAGGIAAGLRGKQLSPEAQAAAVLYQHSDLSRLKDCGSARELIGRGFARDVDLCLQQNVSSLACILKNDAFIAAA
ncbi:hypothetical protein GW590_20760 [Rahnella sp. SAP-1]|uniref:Probable 2-phosphosulfolactate phosphatase n=1 Tax=Rouxiella aceris TaxID=2703884 RepID=A0A848MTM0_9GAMM|nr:2-phosphosulfolactate phosphatase [Rouxiella aceris]NMP29284.1 hypothetical protein [Rouxiella aceris]